MLAAITGLAAILHTSALAFEIIKYAGVAYLLYMAWATLRETGALSVESAVSVVYLVVIGVGGLLIARRRLDKLLLK